MTCKKPKRLQKGDTVAIVSPSWGGPSQFSHIYENGLNVLREWGLNITEYPTARMDASELRANPEVRAKDLNDAYADPEVDAIITSIGGNDSCRILPFLDRETIAENPKIFMGYSDATTIHTYLSMLGITSLYGPSIMAGFSQADALPPEYKTHLFEMLFNPCDRYEYTPYKQYANGYPNWAERENIGKVNPFQETDGWHFLRGSGKTTGQITGGCIEVLEMIKGTDFWPEKSYWKDKIFFFETSEEATPVEVIDHILRNYGMMGIFSQISGLIVGRARDYSEDDKKALEDKILGVVVEEFGRKDLPIVTNFDIGHTDPQVVLPLGTLMEVNTDRKTIALTEPWLS